MINLLLWRNLLSAINTLPYTDSAVKNCSLIQIFIRLSNFKKVNDFCTDCLKSNKCKQVICDFIKKFLKMQKKTQKALA